MKRILVCGGRNYGHINPGRVLERPKKRAERRNVVAVLDKAIEEFGPFLLIHGGAKGADALAAEFAKVLRNLPEPLIFPALWDDVNVPGAVVRVSKKTGRPYNVLAGHFRNQKMVDEGKPDLVIAFPGGTGTADMVERAEKAGLEVRKIA